MRIGCCLPGDNIMPKDKEYTWAEVLLYGDKLIMRQALTTQSPT